MRELAAIVMNQSTCGVFDFGAPLLEKIDFYLERATGGQIAVQLLGLRLRVLSVTVNCGSLSVESPLLEVLRVRCNADGVCSSTLVHFSVKTFSRSCLFVSFSLVLSDSVMWCVYERCSVVHTLYINCRLTLSVLAVDLHQTGSPRAAASSAAVRGLCTPNAAVSHHPCCRSPSGVLQPRAYLAHALRCPVGPFHQHRQYNAYA